MSDQKFPSPTPTRRTALLGAIAVGAAASGALTGCAAGSRGSSTKQGTKSAGNPFGVRPDARLDVVVFKGGYGDDYAKGFEDLYKKAFPPAEISHQGLQDITGALQPLFNGGTPPDVIDDSGAKQLKLDVLYDQGQLTDLTQLLDAPSIDDPAKKVRDTLVPGTIETGSFNGKMYSLNYAFQISGLWYSNRTFQQNGWTVPKTWDDFMTLCATIKASGKMAPFAHQGKYPFYILVPIMDLAMKNGGEELAKKIDNLEPNAWMDDSVRSAVEAVYMLVDRGYMMPGTEGLTHIESQTAWCNGRAAIIPCGSWLENEQLNATPAGFDMAVMPMPSLSANDQMPYGSIRSGATESFIVPTKAHNQAGGLEFMRIMCSKAGGALFAQKANSLSVVKDSITPAVAGTLKPGTRSSNAAFQASNGHTISFNYYNWYSQFETDLEAATGELMANRIKPAEWVKRAQAAADRTAQDSSIKKFTRS